MVILKFGEVWENAKGERIVLDRWFDLSGSGYWHIHTKDGPKTMAEDDILHDFIRTRVQPGQWWSLGADTLEIVGWDLASGEWEYGVVGGSQLSKTWFTHEERLFRVATFIEKPSPYGPKSHGKGTCACGTKGALVLFNSFVCMNSACRWYQDPADKPWRRSPSQSFTSR